MSLLEYLKQHLLLLSSFAAVFLLTTLLTFVSPQATIVKKDVSAETNHMARLPLLKTSEGFPVLTAQSVYAIDLDSSVVLYEKNAEARLLPASTTKIVTALVAINNYDLNEVINTGSFYAAGSRMGLVWYENITVKDLLYGLLVQSANDAAEVLANAHPAGRDSFILEMNMLSKKLYATDTNFANPSGLDDDNQYTTAKDLVRIASFAMKNPVFAEIVQTETYVAKSTDEKFVHPLTNRNELLGEVEGVLGVKTGWTENARENLVTFVTRDEKTILIGLLGSQDRFGETKELIEWLFSHYDWQSVILTPEHTDQK